MDYDKTNLAAGYNRGRDHGPAFRTQWMEAVARHVNRPALRCVLDLGCGTGRFSLDLAERFGCEVVGIDPSRKMLEEARVSRAHANVFYCCGAAEAIPLDSRSVDLIFISMAYHHFTNPDVAAGECCRVLREDGRLFLRTGGSERIPLYPYVPFFPRSRALLEEHLPTLESQRRVFEAAGFRLLVSDCITQQIAADLSAYADKLATRSDSILVRLTDAEFDSGMEALRHAAAMAPSKAVTEPIDFMVFAAA
jgi:SAM-dependent methyltransferase